MKIIILQFLFILFVFPFYGQSLPAKQAYPLNVKQIHSGHSLTDPLFANWPGQYVNLIGHVNSLPPGSLVDVMVGKSTIPGSPLQYRWNNPPGYGSPDARHDIANWEVLSITERVPLLYEGGSTQQWYLDGIQEQKHFLSLFVNNAWNNGNGGNGAPTMLWTTWTNLDNSNGPWRQMLDIQGAEFERMQDYANNNRPSGAPPVYIIPGHKMMARLYDDIDLAIVPGISNINQFFLDNIHVNELGAYAVSLLHYSCFFNTSPVGLPVNLLPDAPPGTPIPTQALATYLQNMIWDVVTSYPRTGITNALPVNFENLKVKNFSNKNEISFTALNEKDNAYFTIERSSDGINFTSIGKLNGSLNSSTVKKYAYVDHQPLQGLNYYRIKQTDANEQFSFSKIVTVWNASDYSDKLTCMIVNSEISFTHNIDNGYIRIFDINGSLVKSIFVKNGDNTISIIDLPAGIFYVFSGNNLLMKILKM